MTIWHMISNSSFFVQCVLIILFLASIVSWSIIIQRIRLIKNYQKKAEKLEQSFWSGIDCKNLWQKTSTDSGLAEILNAGCQRQQELMQTNLNIEQRLQSIQTRMQTAIERMLKPCENNISWLATIGSVAPYVGLLGTVWGILGTFQQLGQAQQASLAQVAPGISEALVATAIGLLVAIPAVVGYNRLRNRIDALGQQAECFCDDFIAVLQRQWYSSCTNQSDKNNNANEKINYNNEHMKKYNNFTTEDNASTAEDPA